MEGIQLNKQEQQALINALRLMSIVVYYPETKVDKTLWAKIINDLNDYLYLLHKVF